MEGKDEKIIFSLSNISIDDTEIASDSESEKDDTLDAETVFTGLQKRNPGSASVDGIPNWRERGHNVYARRIPTERNFREYRNTGNTRKTPTSCKGNWFLKCENSTVDEYGKTEADIVWKAVTELYEADPITYGFPPSKHKLSDRLTVAINIYTPDYNDMDNILNTAKVIHNCIFYPYMMTYWRSYDRQMLFMYTPEEEVYRLVGYAWRFMQ